MLLNCGAGEDSWYSLGQQGYQPNQSWRKSVLNIHWQDWCWTRSSSTLATWCKELTQWKRPLCWERLKAGGEGDDREWDGWMGSPTWWTWVWASSGSWWWTGKPGILQSMGSQSGGLNWVIELNWVVGCFVPCNRKCHKRWTSKSFAFFSFSSQTHHCCSDVIHMLALFLFSCHILLRGQA